MTPKLTGRASALNPAQAPALAQAARWAPAVTVAAIVEEEGRYLLVEERTERGLKLNNPAGHLEPGETLLAAVQREVLEETARPFTPTALVGIYQARNTAPGAPPTAAYLRFAFTGTVGAPLPGRVLDAPIVRTVWLTPQEAAAQAQHMRSPLVLRCIADHAAGARHALALLHALDLTR